MVIMILPNLVNNLRGRLIPSGINDSQKTSLWIFDKKSGLTVIQKKDENTIIVLPCEMGADTSRSIFENSNSASIIYNMISEVKVKGFRTILELNHNEFFFDESPLLYPVSSFSIRIQITSNDVDIDWLENLIADVMEDLQSVISTVEFGSLEGQKFKTHVSRYERDEGNRAACIEFHGTSCKICGVNFQEKYPGVSDGFIHVHHIEQLSELSKPRVFDPRVDLIPVCPNCHAMLHSRKPPMKPDELREIIQPYKQRNAE